jgi:hypothetical protein
MSGRAAIAAKDYRYVPASPDDPHRCHRRKDGDGYSASHFNRSKSIAIPGSAYLEANAFNAQQI